MQHRPQTLVVSLAILGLIAAACGDDDSATTTDAAPITSAAITDTSQTSDTPTTTEAAATNGIAAPEGLTGIWEGELAQLSTTGACPSMPTQRGTVLIDQTGSEFTLTFDEGFACDPFDACAFAGTAEGNEYSATNGGVADTEGGLYTTSFVLIMDSADHGEGLGDSAYTLGGMTCTWDTTLELIGRQE